MEEDRPDDKMIDAACGAAEGLPGEDSINQAGRGCQQRPEIRKQSRSHHSQVGHQHPGKSSLEVIAKRTESSGHCRNGLYNKPAYFA